MSEKKIVNNTIMLMIFNIAKIIFPFITLPYLTRILTLETYGVVTYVKTVMTYMQIFIDFGFILSATKDVVKSKKDGNEIGKIVGDTLLARILLGLFVLIIIIFLILLLPILRNNAIYTILSYIAIFESIFLMDFLFRGIEKMHVITVRFIVMKIISTICTFIFIKNDSNMLLIPIFEIISSTIAVILVFFEVKKLNIKLKISGIKNAFKCISKSFVYFLSNVAATSLNAISTIIIGIYLNSSEVAFWGLCMQIIGTITACYTPISDGIYPEMIKNKDLKMIKKILVIFLPIVFCGCIFSYLVSNIVFIILGGTKYLEAVPIFRLLIPTLFFGFPAVILGWPTLGAIDKNKEITTTTVISVIFYIIFLIVLILINKFTLINIAIGRSITEFILFLSRFLFFCKNKKLFIENY